MEQDTTETIMIFKKFENGDVIAIMPNELADPNGNVMSYMRVGQHGAASLELIDDLQDASKEERKNLIKELGNLGYLVKEGN